MEDKIVKEGVKGINLNIDLLDMDGKSVPETDEYGKVIDGKTLKLSRVLADFMLKASSKQGLKLFEISMDLISTGRLDVDTTDKALVIKFIDDHERMSNLLKGRLTLAIEGKVK